VSLNVRLGAWVDLFRADREQIMAKSARAGSALRVHELYRDYLAILNEGTAPLSPPA
jgi:hypothetical protein